MAEYYSTYNMVLYWITLVVIIIGLLGNILTFMVFSRKKFRKNSISVYCRALAIFDSFIVYIAVVLFYFVFYKTFIARLSDSMCKFYFYVKLAFSSIPGWILIAFSIDKIINLRKVSNRMKRPIVHYWIIVAIVLFNLLLYIEVPIFIERVPIKTILLCDTNYLWFSDALNIKFLIEGSLLPFFILCVSSLYTIKLLRDSRRQLAIIGRLMNRRKKREIKFAITSLVFNILFILLKIPLLICSIIGYHEVNYLVLQFAYLCFFTYFSMGFFIHFASNSLFRSELILMLRFRKPHKRTTNNQIYNQAKNRRFNTIIVSMNH